MESKDPAFVAKVKQHRDANPTHSKRKIARIFGFPSSTMNRWTKNEKVYGVFGPRSTRGKDALKTDQFKEQILALVEANPVISYREIQEQPWSKFTKFILPNQQLVKP